MVDDRVKRHGMPAVIFDGDDTLWQTEPLYDEARTATAAYVGELGMDPQEFETTQKTIDVERAKSIGLSRSRFPGSSVQAVQELAKHSSLHLGRKQLRRVSNLSSEVFQKIAPVFPNADSVLSELRESYQIALLTKGDEQVQRKRLADSGLAHLFDFAHIVDDKDESSFKYVLARLQANPIESWSVGNSNRSDILPALNIGMQAIWIEAPVWAHEDPVKLEGMVDRYHIATQLSDVPTIISPIQAT